MLRQHAQAWKSRKAAGICPAPSVGPRHVHAVQEDTAVCWQGPAERAVQGGCRIQGTVSPISGQSCCMQTPLCPLLQSHPSLFKALQLQPLNLNYFFFSFFFFLIKLFFFLNSPTSDPHPLQNTLLEAFYNLLTAKETAQNNVTINADNCAFNYDSQLFLFSIEGSETTMSAFTHRSQVSLHHL